MEYFEIYNGMEIPGLGCGYRRVFAKEGRKHVQLFYPGDCSFHKLPVRDWERLKPRNVDYKRAAILNHINNFGKIMGIRTKQFKEIKTAIKALALAALIILPGQANAVDRRLLGEDHAAFQHLVDGIQGYHGTDYQVYHLLKHQREYIRHTPDDQSQREFAAAVRRLDKRGEVYHGN